MISNLPVYPWQQRQWERLRAPMAANRLPHALLLAGPPGLGKAAFARGLTQALLCSAPNEHGACGECKSCLLNSAGNHPDIYLVGLEEDSRVLKVDAVRALANFATLKSQFGGRKVGLIHPADRMNTNAANSLLKTLEEPPSGAVIILVADRSARLPATVRSRCQRIDFQPPDREMAAVWLGQQADLGQERADQLMLLANGAPCRAIELAEQGADVACEKLVQQLLQLKARRASPVEVAAGWGKDTHGLLLDLLIVTVQSLIRQESGAEALHPAGQALDRLRGKLDVLALHEYLDFLYSMNALTDRALNPQLYAEDLFLRWSDACRPSLAHGCRSYPQTD